MQSGFFIRKQPLRTLFALSVLQLLSSLAFGQGENGYLRGRGGLVVAIDRSSSVFEEEVSAGSFLDVDRTTLGLYFNLGLRDDLDLIVQPLVKRARPDDLSLGDGEERLTDLILALKWRVWRREFGPGELHMLLAPGVQTPLSNYETEGTFALGSGHTDYRARGILHYQSRTGVWWSALEGGYDFRTGPNRDVLALRAQIGINLGLFVLQPFYDKYDARGGDDSSGTGGVESAGIDYIQYGLKAFVPLSRRIGVTLSTFHLDDDRDSGSTEGFSVGFVYSG